MSSKAKATKAATKPSATLTVSERLEQYQQKYHGKHETAKEEDIKLQRLFAARSAHLPGNNWCQDWTQWMRNNHPILGLCCRHPLNPVGVFPRCVILLSSISFGMIATNLVYLFYRYHPDANDSLVDINYNNSSFQVTYETIMLWTLAGLLHTLADLGMWHLTACACCFNSFVAKIGPYVAICISALLAAVSTFVVLWRASYEIQIIDGGDGGNGNVDGTSNGDVTGQDGDVNYLELENLQALQFIVSYFIELLFVYVLYHPLLSTIFFSGSVWGILPCIGGRPKEIRRQEEEEKKTNLKKKLEQDLA